MNENQPKILHEFRFDANALSGWEEFSEYMSGGMPEMREGLYVFFFVNETNEIIFDNNKNREKPIIYGQGASLKPGKFENGIMKRLKNYQDHLHWPDTDGTKNWVFTQCVRHGFILDLSSCDIGLRSAARVFELYWVDSVNRFVDSEKLWAPAPVNQLARSEWKYLDPALWNEEVETRLRNFLNELAGRVLKMVDLVRAPFTIPLIA